MNEGLYVSFVDAASPSIKEGGALAKQSRKTIREGSDVGGERGNGVRVGQPVDLVLVEVEGFGEPVKR